MMYPLYQCDRCRKEERGKVGFEPPSDWTIVNVQEKRESLNLCGVCTAAFHAWLTMLGQYAER